MPIANPIPSLGPFQIGWFWERVQVDMFDTDACFPWTGALTKKGYGRVKFARVYGHFYAHRVAYTLTRGPIPGGLTLDHTCRNRRCCNPAHLEPVTSRENTMRGVGITAECARKTHCKQGHPYDEANTGPKGNGRYCRLCNRDRMRITRGLRDRIS